MPENLDKFVSFRVKPSEWDLIESEIAERDIRQSEWLREVVVAAANRGARRRGAAYAKGD